MKRSWVLPLVPFLAAACGSTEMSPALADGIAYEVTFEPAWTATSHPLDYPKAGLVSGPHFSGLIGASHGNAYVLFAEGLRPTPGLERLSEEGKHAPLDAEIDAAIAAGQAGERFETGAIKDFTKPVTAIVHVNRSFPRVSVAAMIAPSPDWFAGVADVDLRDGSGWVAKKELRVEAFDAGGDAGTTYEAADADLDPKQPTRRNDAPQFTSGGTRAPVGRITFRRM